MNSKKFMQRSMTDTLTLLCFARGGSFLLNGKPNQSEIARQAGTSQSNISRWYSGNSKPTDDNILNLAKAFKITPAQMRGELPINAIDSYIAKSPEDEQFFNDFLELPDEAKNLIREQINFYHKLNAKTK